jgi:hypothetical protein
MLELFEHILLFMGVMGVFALIVGGRRITAPEGYAFQMAKKARRAHPDEVDRVAVKKVGVALVCIGAIMVAVCGYVEIFVMRG